MHKIIGSFLSKFSEENGFESEEESTQFEYFVNYIVAYDKYPREFDVREITSDDVDGGIDGIIFLADDELASTLEEVKSIFSRPKKIFLLK